MHTKLTRVGDQLSLCLEPSLLAQLGINQDTLLEVKIDGSTLTVRPIEIRGPERLGASLGRMMDAHDQTLQELAK